MKVDGVVFDGTEGTGVPASYLELRPALDELWCRRNANLAKIVRLESQPCADRTSFNLLDLEIELADGTVLRLLLKDLGMKNLHETARRVKPRFLYDPLREIKTYQEILAPKHLGTARFYGAVVSPDEDRYWLFLEKIPGLRLGQARDHSAWLQAARWLAQLHSRFAGASDTLNRSAPLLRYDSDYYRVWLDRMAAFQCVGLQQGVLETLAGSYDRVIERLIRLPSTLLHGEFYPSNILVQETREGSQIRPVDWETAAVGPGLVDLAALTSGAWTERDRTEMATAYHDTLLSEGMASLPFNDLLLALDDCRLHLAIRWLGWAADWVPPPENVHDWLKEAIALAEKMTSR
jgi:hypothetical protein